MILNATYVMVVLLFDFSKLNGKLKNYEPDFVIMCRKENLKMSHYMNKHWNQTF